MADRELIAAVLAVGLGIVFILSPATIVQVHTAGRIPDRHGEYGADGAPARWLWVVRAVGAALLLAGIYFAASVLSLL